MISEVMNMDVSPYDSVIEVMDHDADDLARIDLLNKDFERQ